MMIKITILMILRINNDYDINKNINVMVNRDNEKINSNNYINISNDEKIIVNNLFKKKG